MRLRLPALLLVSAAFLAAGCSSSSDTVDTSAVEGLNTPSQLSIVTAQEEETLGAGGVAAGAGATNLPAGTDYFTDLAETWVFDPSVQPIQQVNEILCMLGQTRAAAMVNEGPYLAQINTTRCAQGSNDDGDQGQSSGGAPELELWTVRSERASNTAVQNVGVWVPESNESGDYTIFVNADVERAPSATNPFGVFSLDFASATTAAGLSDPGIVGTLATTPVEGTDGGFTFYQSFQETQENGSISELVQVNVTMSADQTEGFGRVFRSFDADFGPGGSFDEEQSFTVAFDETHLLRQSGNDTPVCLSREDFDTKVWRYNLYHADGEDIGGRVERNSGFGFRTEGDEYGWMGYYGMWVPEDVLLESGDTVYEDVWGAEEAVEYTIFQSPGRLIRFQRENLDLADIAGQVFQWWTWDEQTQQSAEYRISFDGAVWTKVAEVVYGEEGVEVVAIDPPEVIAFDQGEWVGLWSEGLGGHVDYIHGDACGCVTVYSEEIVTPEDPVFANGTDVSFYGYFDMLGTGITQQAADSGDVYLSEAPDAQTPHEFTMSPADMTLRDGQDAAVGFAEGVVPESGPYTWGVRSGPMVTDTSGLTSIWDVFEEDVYYVYETGPNDWNRYTAAVDSEGDFVVFDPPLQFAYTHSTSADRNGDSTYDGQTFFLNYEGAGNLWGIPHEGVDTDGDSVEDRWYPQFSLADGTLVGPTGTEYVVKAMEMEQTLSEAPGECGALGLTEAQALVLPDGSAFQVPAIGDAPAVEDPPAVVDGVVQAGS